MRLTSCPPPPVCGGGDGEVYYHCSPDSVDWVGWPTPLALTLTLKRGSPLTSSTSGKASYSCLRGLLLAALECRVKAGSSIDSEGPPSNPGEVVWARASWKVWVSFQCGWFQS